MLRLLFASIFILLSACSSLPNGQPQDWQWQLTGRAVFQSPEQRDSANILWQSAPGRDSVQLSGPFGQGAVRLIADGDGASLWSDGELRASDSSIEALLSQQLNWRVPVEQLREWVRGNGASDDAATLSERQFEQDGWRVAQSKFNADGLPRKVVIERPPYKLTLLIAKWTP